MIATRNKHIVTPHHAEPQLDALAASAEARALRKRVWGLAAPVIGENFLETLLGIVDTLLVAGLGAVAIAVRADSRAPYRQLRPLVRPAQSCRSPAHSAPKSGRT